MIKVLHIFGKMVRGGSELRTVELMPLLSEKGVHFDFCTVLPGKGPLDEKIHQLGGKVLPCPLRPGLVSFGRRFVKLLEQSDYDIVHSHTHYFSGNIVRLADKAGIGKRIVHFRSIGDGKKVTLKRKLYHHIMRGMIDKYATAILAVGSGAMEYGWRQDWPKDPRCKIIHNGLDLSVFDQAVIDRDGVYSELGIPKDGKLVIYVARFIWEKAHDLLLDAAAQVILENPKIHFLFVGDGELRQAMEAKAHALKIEKHVHFVGERDDVPRLLKASDCFVLPSLREGLPGVVLEAIAANLPVIAADLPGVREIAEHTDLIYLVPIGDRDAIHKKILKTVEELDSQPHIKRSFPVEFDLHHCAEQLFKVYSR
jgi:glycosyltransferase involved in cell wall biosynthesis